MRTKEQQERENTMLANMKSLILRNRETLIEDMLGAATLVVLLFAALHLPGLI